MRYQIRLIDQYLPDFAHDIAQAAWDEMGDILPELLDREVYRELNRAVREVLEPRIQAFRFCGAAHRCEQSLEPRARVIRFEHEAYPGERVRVYLMDADMPPSRLREALEQELLRVATRAVPGRKLKGLGPRLRQRLEKLFRGKIFKSQVCGESPLCEMNESYDPWEVAVRADQTPGR